jgi:diacylglycerol kinase (ATP)
MKRLVSGFRFAIKGFRTAVLGQRNLRFHLVVGSIVIVAGFVFNISVMEWCILLLCIGFVVSAELVNTAIEELVNMISPERKEQAGKIKDIAAGAVLWAAMISALIGVIIFDTRIFLPL